jgi:hypothetical protein
MKLTYWQAKIYRAKDNYSPTSDKTKVIEGSVDNCAVGVTSGSIPQDVLDAQAAMPGGLYRLTGLHGPSPTGIPTDWTDERELYTTVTVSYEIDMEAISGEYFHLLQEPYWWATHPAELGLAEFKARAGPVFEKVLGGLLRALNYDIVHVPLRDSAVFIDSLHGEVMPAITSTAGSVRASVERSMDELDSLPFSKVLDPSVLHDGDGITRTIGRWFGTALSDEDPVKQFLWCFAGLESVSSKLIRSIRSELVEKVHFVPSPDSDPIRGQAVNELLWPTAHQDETDKLIDPQRNTVFKFAAMALTASPESANEDVLLFKRMQAFRNRIHGGDLLDAQTAQELAPAALKLLAKYASLVLDRMQ